MRSESENNLQHMLIKCITACEVCATECLKEKDCSMMMNCIMLDRDCADICALLSRYVARGSRFTGKIIDQCIEICKACEAECKKHEHSHCQKCAEVCHECHTLCEKYRNEHLAA